MIITRFVKFHRKGGNSPSRGRSLDDLKEEEIIFQTFEFEMFNSKEAELSEDINAFWNFKLYFLDIYNN